MFLKLLPFVTLASLACNTLAYPTIEKVLQKRDCKSDYEQQLAKNGGKNEVAPYQCGSIDNKSRKSDLISAGASTLDLAITAQETGCYMKTNSPGYPLGDGKTGDAANYSPFKLNWFHIRTYAVGTKYHNRQESDGPASGAEINGSDEISLQVLHSLQQNTPGGLQGFFKYHRGGASATDAQGQEYSIGIAYIQREMEAHKGDNMVPAYILQCI